MLTNLAIRNGIWWIGVLALLTAGCGRNADNGPAPVVGKISYQGRPLPTGTIVFSPDAARGSSGDLARGEIQPDGSYRLQCGEKPGVAPGSYRVTVIAVETAPAGSTPRSYLPLKYRDPELSGLDCEVVAGKENTINFNLQ